VCAGRRIDVIDDTYNANPDSMQAAIAVLAELPAPRLLVLGDMGEVGDQGPAFHTEVGASAKQAGIETLLVMGSQMQHAVAAFGAGATHCEDMAALIAAVQARMGETASVLVKGSRSMKMEQVVQALESTCGEGAACC
jgi:UDP-N-acetylmuramoyl-tripeptide--D-alanyl-D-alanine ligase